MTPDDDELVQLEEAGWRALATGGDAATAFFERVLAPRIVALLPGGIVIDDRNALISAMHGVPWDAYRLSDTKVVRLARDVAVVVYRAHARRGDHEYDAWFASTYVHDAQGWRLAVHQQTPS